MFAALFLAPELFHFHREPDYSSWASNIGDFFKILGHLQEDCSSAAFWAGFNHAHFPPQGVILYPDQRERLSFLLASLGIGSIPARVRLEERKSRLIEHGCSEMGERALLGGYRERSR